MPKSDKTEWTPCPGDAVPADKASNIVAAFESRFRVNTSGRHPKVPTWVAFDPSASRRATPRAFQSRSIADEAEVFLWFEGRELRRTTMGDVRRYLAALEPWEDWDLYVFDPALSWSIALTHPQMGNQRLVIVAGTFPPRG